MDQLRVLWRDLMGAEINFDVEVTGFETAEIDLLVDGEAKPEKPDRSDLVPAVGAEPVSRLGDLWILGEHRLLCGDTCRSTVMSAGLARSSTASSRWLPAR
ncbi:hypothetical protein IVA79_17360 [Bradyrhizobium sp. 138]|uniref:hypothetical protein n=1 Tax=Bradyrhizobium sp. 138 TaxID=2782615 RepID=UPI001FFA28E3|nr:hypothetical protein [Bradyrhizobium sp. 138]MCK1735691.1 hypothetical protein [Bradyrhizobium sp. 138]